MYPFQDMTERLETLNKIGIALSSETNLTLLLESIVRETRSFANADAGSLYLVDQDNGALHFEVAQNDTLRKRADMKPDTFKPYSLALQNLSISSWKSPLIF